MGLVKRISISHDFNFFFLFSRSGYMIGCLRTAAFSFFNGRIRSTAFAKLFDSLKSKMNSGTHILIGIVLSNCNFGLTVNLRSRAVKFMALILLQNVDVIGQFHSDSVISFFFAPFG